MGARAAATVRQHGEIAANDLVTDQWVVLESHLHPGTVETDDMVDDKKDADGVSADKNALGADRDMGGELTAGERTKEYEAALNQAQAAVRQASKDAPSIQKPPPHPKDRVVAHVATGVGAEGGAPARRGGAVDSLNSPNSSSGKAGVSSSDSADPAPDPALDKKDTHVATGDGDEDDDEVIHRGGARPIINSDDEGSGGKTGVESGDTTTGEGVESDGLQDTDSEGGSASHAGHCATLGIAHNAPKKEIKEAFRKLPLQHDPDKNPGDKEGASERGRKVEKAKDFL